MLFAYCSHIHNQMSSYFRFLSLFTILLMLLLLLPMAAKGDIIGDIFGKVCEEVECGKGKCVANKSYPLNFICECQPGWKRTRDEDNDTNATSFLPCVIPQCNMNYGCQSAPPPVPEKSFPHNISAFDPCYWAYCGEGKCTKNKTHTYRCECNPNSFNLLNISVFPCYTQCAIGSNCTSLGIKSGNSTADIGSQASPIFPGRLHWIVMMLLSTGMVMWN